MNNSDPNLYWLELTSIQIAGLGGHGLYPSNLKFNMIQSTLHALRFELDSKNLKSEKKNPAVCEDGYDVEKIRYCTKLFPG